MRPRAAADSLEPRAPGVNGRGSAAILGQARDLERVLDSMTEQSLLHLRRAIRLGRYRLTEHAEHEREADTIAMHELEEAFSSANVEILEDYPRDPRGPSALFLGFTKVGRPIHAVIGLSGPAIVVVVTVYRPDSKLWKDWRIRI
ncbi:MAG: DUF4258 domain-containing protein [Chloroflexi bacterium]|nr:DUF4258 domain-containing protein [Chloroflexota bacterium]